MNALTSMKPFQLILLVVFGFLAILGLVVFAGFSGFKNSSAKLGSVTIWGTLPADSMTSFVNHLQSTSPEYANVSYAYKPEQEFDTDLAEAIAGGNGPDLILISQEQLVTEQDKLLVVPFSTISERTFLSTYLPIDELFLASNGTYGIPFAVDPLVLYYNRSVLSNAGIATPPTSWEAITSLAQSLTQSQGGVISRSVVPFGVYGNVANARAIVSLLLLQAGNSITSVDSNGIRAHLTDGGESSTNTTPAQSAMSFYTQFADPVKTVYTWNRALGDARQQFLAGELAFYPGFASEASGLKAANPNLDFDMTAIPQPQTSTQRITFAKAYAFAIPKASKNASGAQTVAFALAAPSLGATVAQTLSMSPAARSALAPANNDPYQAVYFRQALIAKGWLSPSPQTTDTIFSTMISNITSGSMELGQALDTANQALNAAL